MQSNGSILFRFCLNRSGHIDGNTSNFEACVNEMSIPGGNNNNNNNNVNYEWPLHLIMTMVFSSLTLIGVIGNILVITVVFRVKHMISPTNCYLVSLAVSDTLFFIATSPTEISYLHLPSNEYAFGHLGCALFTYLPYLAINTSSLSIAAFTIERFIGICYPIRARYICTVKRAKVIIFCIWLFCLAYNSPWLYLTTLKQYDDSSECGFKLERDNWTYKMIYLGDFAAFYLIPMILYVVIYTKIALTLSSNEMGDRLKLKSSLICTACQTGSSRSPSPPLATQLLVQSTSDNENKNTMRLQIPINPVIHVTPKEFFVNGNRRSTQRNRNQVVKMLAVVVLVFAVCWLPYRAMVMYNSFASPESKFYPDWYIFLSKTMIYINCAINPILYNLMSGRFRNAFKRLLKGEKKSIYSMSSTAGMSTKVRASTTESRILVENIVHDDDELSIPVIDQAELEEHD